MATVKQLALRIKYAKITISKFNKLLNVAKAKAKALEGELKKAKSTAAKKPAKKGVKKATRKK